MTDYTTASSLGNKVNLKEYNEKGFVVLKNQIPEEALDQIINETHQVFKLKMNSVGFSFDKEKQHLETDELFNFFEKYIVFRHNFLKLFLKKLKNAYETC